MLAALCTFALSTQLLALPEERVVKVAVVDAAGALLDEDWLVWCRTWDSRGRPRRFNASIESSTGCAELMIPVSANTEVYAIHTPTGFHVPWRSIEAPASKSEPISELLRFTGYDPAGHTLVEFESAWLDGGFPVRAGIDITFASNEVEKVQVVPVPGSAQSNGSLARVALRAGETALATASALGPFELAGEVRVSGGHRARIPLRGRSSLALDVVTADGHSVDAFTVRAHTSANRNYSFGSGVELPFSTRRRVVDGVPTLPMVLCVSAPGHVTAFTRIEDLVHDGTTEVRVTLERAYDLVGRLVVPGRSAEGIVVAANETDSPAWGLPISGALGSLRYRTVDLQPGRYAKADTEGSFRIPGLPMREYRLDVAIGRWIHVSQTVSPGERVRLEAPMTGDLSLQLLLPRGHLPGTYFVRPRLTLPPHEYREVAGPFFAARHTHTPAFPGARTASGVFDPPRRRSEVDIGLDPDGRFEFEGLPEGEVEFELVHRTRPDRAYDLGTVTIVGGESTVAAFDARDLLPVVVEFVAAIDGSPAQQRLRFEHVRKAEGAFVVRFVDPGESATFGELERGPQLILVSEVSGAWLSRHGISLADAAPPRMALDVRMLRGRLQLCDESDDALRSTEVRIYHDATTTSRAVRTSDPSGHVELSLPEGGYVVERCDDPGTRGTFRWPPKDGVTAVRLRR